MRALLARWLRKLTGIKVKHRVPAVEPVEGEIIMERIETTPLTDRHPDGRMELHRRIANREFAKLMQQFDDPDLDRVRKAGW